MRSPKALLATVLLGAGLAGAAAVCAEEAAVPAPAAPAGPSVILQMLNRPSESMEMSIKESLRPDLTPAPASRADAPERMPDGSVRYGKTRVNVKVNADCPDDPFHEAAPPPPRRAR